MLCAPILNAVYAQAIHVIMLCYAICASQTAIRPALSGSGIDNNMPMDVIMQVGILVDKSGMQS